jgi:hypothetical protein
MNQHSTEALLTQDYSALVNFMGMRWFMAGRRAKRG